MDTPRDVAPQEETSMSTNRDRVNAQTEIRRAMLANGYTPLANAEKMCLLEGWPTLEVDDAMIDSWADSTRYQSTGLRIDGDLCAVDIDIDDKYVVYALWDWAEETFGRDWAERVLIRVREGAYKETWLFRVDEPFGVPTGPKYGRPGEESDHCVELYGSSQKRQIGVYGWHTANEITYEWAEDRGPVDVLLEDLPIVPKALVFSIYEKSAELMKSAGWERRDTKFAPGEHGSIVYDLPADLMVVTAAGEMSLDEAAGGRCRMKEITGEGTNTSRGLVSMTDKGPMVWDSESYTTHATPEARPEDIGETVLGTARALGERLKALRPAEVAKAAAVATAAQVEREAAEDTWERMEAFVDELVECYALFETGSDNERWVDLRDGTGRSDKALRMKLARHAMTLPTTTPQGRETTKRVNPVDVLVGHPDLIDIAGYRFTPGNDARLVLHDGKQYLNMWTPVWFGDVEPDMDVEWFLDFLDYLVPGEEEQMFVLNWIAHKVRNPGERGVGLLLVTPKMGTGRNVLMKIMGLLLGTQFCGDVSQAVLTGTSAQSQYDDALIDRVLITCDEIVAGHASYDLRAKAYERLKSVVDPYVQPRSFNRKGLSMIRGSAHYSALLASNHPYDALPLPPGDRRFAVVECTREPFKDHRPDIKRIVDNVLPLNRGPNMARLAGLHAWLLEYETDADAFYTVPDTVVRRTMIEDGEGDIEKTIRRFLEKLPEDQTCFRFDDLARRGKDWLSDHPQAARAFEKLARKKMREGFAGWTMEHDRVRVEQGPGNSVLARSIVERDDVDVTPAERARWLGVEEE